MVPHNESTPDRVVRAVLGSGLILCSLRRWGLTAGRPLGIVGGLLGAILLGSAATGFCPLYRVTGLSTAHKD